MKKSNTWFTILCLLILWHTQAISVQRSCSPTFSSREEKFLNLAVKAEELIIEASNRGLLEAHKDITDLQSIIEQKIAAIFDKRGHFSRRSFFQLKRDVETLENILSTKLDLLNSEVVNDNVVNNVDPNLVDLINDPSIIQANMAYRIHWPHNSHASYVLFDQTIVDAFFHAKRDLKHQLIVVRKNLKALQKGYTKKKSESGIKLLTLPAKGGTNNHPNYYRNKMFEIKTIGKISGHIRWGGFIDGDVLYVVHYSNNTHGHKHKHVFTMALWDKLQNFHLSDRRQLSYHY